MTAQIEKANPASHRTRWQRLWAWFAALEQAMDYDPQEYTNETIKDLKRETVALEVRIRNLEACQQRVA